MLTIEVPKIMDPKLQKHFLDFDNYLKKAKKDFDVRWRADFKPNATLADFHVMRTLGTGSFGRVVLAQHKQKEGKLLAIKMMEKKHVVKTKQVQHTISEIRIMDSLNFPFMIKMEYFFQDNVYLFLAMPLINGGEMFSHLRNMRKFDENLSRFYTAQVVLAFEYIHYLGLVYRDLKPENILIDSHGFLKITDYGFCKKIDDQRTYTLCGTPEYLAPEIIMSQGYNRSVDWWALGVLIFEMNAGYPPFYAKDPMRIYEKIVSGKYTPPGHFSKALRDLVMNMLQVDRTRRFGVLKNGTKDIKCHEWFKALDWDSVLSKKMKPSFKPKVAGEGDTSNFDDYDEEPIRSSSINEYADEFSAFTVTAK